MKDNLLKYISLHLQYISKDLLTYYQKGEVISSLQMSILWYLFNEENGFTMGELAKKLNISKQQMTKLVNGLEERGLVKRVYSSTNRRIVIITLCDKGRDIQNKAVDEYYQNFSMKLNKLSKVQQEEFYDSITTISNCILDMNEIEH